MAALLPWSSSCAAARRKLVPTGVSSRRKSEKEIKLSGMKYYWYCCYRYYWYYWCCCYRYYYWYLSATTGTNGIAPSGTTCATGTATTGATDTTIVITICTMNTTYSICIVASSVPNKDFSINVFGVSVFQLSV